MDGASWPPCLAVEYSSVRPSGENRAMMEEVELPGLLPSVMGKPLEPMPLIHVRPAASMAASEAAS